MSKQAVAKLKQGYKDKAIPCVCQYCVYFNFDQIVRPAAGHYAEWTEDKNFRCSIGEFAVKKMATCELFSRKESI